MGHPTVLSCSFCIHISNMVMPTFAAWAATFGKTYNGDEFAAREAIYNANVAKYEAHNADETQTFTMGVNEFTDLTLEEFQALNIRGFSSLASVASHTWASMRTPRSQPASTGAPRVP